MNLTLFVACMASIFWDALGHVEKNKGMIKIFFGVGGLFGAVGTLLGLLAYFRAWSQIRTAHTGRPCTNSYEYPKLDSNGIMAHRDELIQKILPDSSVW